MKNILANVAPTLRGLGFKGSGQNYRKLTAEVVMVVNFQKGSGGQRFYVNLGVQPLRVWSDSGSPMDPQMIKEYECMFRRRIPPPQGLFGWPYELTLAMTTELTSAISVAYENYLRPLAEIPGPITNLTPEEFQAQGPASMFGGTASLNAFNFARIALAHGNVARARAFAQIGLADCPPVASGLRAQLEKILKTTAASQ